MTIEQANEYFSSLPEGFAPAEELSAALTADARKVQFVGVAGTAGKTAAAGLLAAILREAAFHVGFYRAGCEPLSARIAIGGVSVDPVLLCQAAEALNAAKPLPREAAELAAAARCFGAAGCKLAVVELPDAGLASALPNMPVCAVTAIGPDGVSRCRPASPSAACRWTRCCSVRPQRPSAPQSLCPAQRQSWRLRPAASVRQAVSWLWWSCRMQVWRLPCPVCRSVPSQPSAPTA